MLINGLAGAGIALCAASGQRQELPDLYQHRVNGVTVTRGAVSRSGLGTAGQGQALSTGE